MSSAHDVGAVIDDMVARGVFRATLIKVGADKATAQQGGRAKNALCAVADGETAHRVAAWQIRWFSGHEMHLKAGDHEVTMDAVLPPLPAQSQLYRDLRAWLKAQQSADLPAHRRLDPARITLTVRNSGGQIRLSLASDEEPLSVLAKRTVQLVHALYLDFLNGPGRLEWVTEAFNLDPDNPRFS